MYAIKNLIGGLATPLTIGLLTSMLAVVFRLYNRSRAARILLIGAAVICYVGSIPVFGDAMIGALEHSYPPLRQDIPLPDVGYVVVLGSGYEPHDNIPVTAALDADGLARIVEGVRLARRIPSARLIVSGGAPPGRFAPALGYAELAYALGVGTTSLVLLDRALDTDAEARSIARLVGKAPFILVTSAYHMPRAMLQLRRAGAQPIPAPTGQLAGTGAARNWRAWLPNSSGLGKTERAIHEYLGFAELWVLWG